MIKKLVINCTVSETRIALVEDGRVAELYLERNNRRGIVGNIYKAKVSRVLPGMQSAFINIGGDRSAFLFGGDIITFEGGEAFLNKEFSQQLPTNRVPIETVLKDGKEILVQVAKEPLGTKGPRVTMLISIPGRYLVLMPEFPNIGISRRIESEESRERLQQTVEEIKPADMGIIVRTAAESTDKETLKKDLEYLLQIWGEIQKKRDSARAPALLYQEPDIILKTTRDLYSEDVSEIIVDDNQAVKQLKHFLCDTIPGADTKLMPYEKENPIFDEYGIEMDIARALSKKVWLPSGGYLIVDQTEALTTFDVNTGKFVGASNAQETILKTNLEAVNEVVYQLRIRNLPRHKPKDKFVLEQEVFMHWIYRLRLGFRFFDK